jgi:UDP-N-acetylmuramate dehydrogenase
MQIRENISLKSYNSFGIDIQAKYFGAFQNVAELEDLLRSNDIQTSRTHLILGGGSNVLFTKNFDGAVLKNDINGIEVVKEDEDYVYIKAGGGENWHSFVMHCIEKGFAGVENLSLIPGNAGASPMQNIGAYGVEIKDVFHELEAFHIRDKYLRTFSAEDCAFGYRESVFKSRYKNQFVICNVTFRLNKQPKYNTSYGAIQQELDRLGVKELSLRTVSQAVANIRSSKLPDPKILGNAGSFFKNPQIGVQQFEELKQKFPSVVGFPVGADSIKVAAGWLIEQCEWKGYRNGDAGCYEKQALVLVNYGNATGKEILELSEQIIQSINKKFGVLLEREVNII